MCTEGKAVVPTQELCAKLKAVRDAMRDPDMVIIARTDGAGRRLIQLSNVCTPTWSGCGRGVYEAPRTIEDIERLAGELPYPKLLNMFWSGKTPVVPKADLERLGFNLVIVPVTSAHRHIRDATSGCGHFTGWPHRISIAHDGNIRRPGSAVNTATTRNWTRGIQARRPYSGDHRTIDIVRRATQVWPPEGVSGGF